MTINECTLTDELFTHIADDNRRQTTYNVTRLLRHVAEHNLAETLTIPVEEHHVEYLVENRGVEKARISALLDHPEWLTRPIVFIKHGEGSVLLIDGTHRYVTFFVIGAPEILARFIPADVAASFIITDWPQRDEAELMADCSTQIMRALGIVGGPEAES